MIWGCSYEKVVVVVIDLVGFGLFVMSCEDLEIGCCVVDVVSLVIVFIMFFIFGEWFVEGSYLDFIGVFKVDMWESDDGVVM